MTYEEILRKSEFSKAELLSIKEEVLNDENRTDTWDMLYYIDGLLQTMDEEDELEKEKILNSEMYKRLEKELHSANTSLDFLMAKIRNMDVQRIGKKDIMAIYGKEEAWALNLLKFMQQRKLAYQINREYYTTKEDLEAFYKEYKGEKVYV